VRSAWPVVALAALLLAPIARAEEEAPAERDEAGAAPGVATWYAQTLAHTDLGINVAYFWSKGPRFRAETVIAGRKVVSIVSGDTYYAYDGVAMRGAAIGRSAAAIADDAERSRPFGNDLQTVIEQGAEKVGEEEIGGRLCERWRITDERGRREVWASADELKLPVRLEIYSRRSGKTIYTEYVNWLVGLPIADAFFEPPPSVEFERLGFDEYMARLGTPVGPVPILYMDLLTGR
jgi:hypothetical protein